MFRFFTSVAVVIALSGCGIEGLMEDTNDKMDQMLGTSNDLKDGQEFMGGFDVFLNKDLPYAARAAAFETMVKLAKEDRVGKYLALPLSLLSIPTVNKNLPNVSIVGQDIIRIGSDARTSLPVPTIDPDTYGVALFSTEKLLKELVGLHQKGLVTEDRKKDVQKHFERFALASTAVIAAKGSSEIAEDGTLVLQDLMPLEQRQLFAGMLLTIADAYEVSEQARASLNLHLEKKLNSVGRIPAKLIHRGRRD